MFGVADSTLGAVRPIRWQRWIFHLGVPLAFVAIALWLMPFSSTFEFDTDEGLSFAQAQLYGQGYALYGEIWTDQPPVFVVILSHWLRFWQGWGLEDGVVVGRSLSLLFATVLVWAFAQVVRLTVSDLAALIATGCLILSCNFLRLSVSAMIGLPSLTLAMLAIYALVIAQGRSPQQRAGLAILSGLALAVSLQIKMYTLFLIPILALFWFLPQKQTAITHPSPPHRAQALRPYSVLFLLSLTLGWLTIAMASGAIAHWGDFWQFHVNDDLKSVFVNEVSWRDVLVFYVQDLDYGILAIWGLGALGLQGVSGAMGTLARIANRSGLTHLSHQSLPLIWLATATILLINHKPLWYHHYLLISIPLCWLAAFGIQSIAQSWQQGQKWQAVISRRSAIARLSPVGWILLFLLLTTPVKFALLHHQNQVFARETAAHHLVFQEVQAYQSQTHWLLTDLPIYAAHGGLNVPPELAMISRKRIASGQITAAWLADLMAKYQPEQVILGRFPELRALLQPELDAHFEERSHPQVSHFIHHRLLNHEKNMRES